MLAKFMGTRRCLRGSGIVSLRIERSALELVLYCQIHMIIMIYEIMLKRFKLK